jgi:hypothetical protein
MPDAKSRRWPMQSAGYAWTHTHEYDTENLTAWLDDHGFDAREVRDVQISVDPHRGAEAVVTYYLRDARECRFAAGDDAAVGRRTIPIRSFPELYPRNRPPRPVAGRPTAPPITTPLIDRDALSAEVRKRHDEHGCDFPKRTRGDRGKRWTCPTCKREWLPIGSPAPLKGGLRAAWADMTTLCRFDLGATHCNLPKDHDGRHDPAPVHDPSDHDPDWAIHRDES